MKKNVLKLLLAMVCLLSSTSVSAYDFEVDGIYYEVISVSDGTCKIVRGDNEYMGDIVIPATFNYDDMLWTVVEIGDAFSYCGSLTSVTIANSVTSIGNRAFSGCSSLTSVTIPNSVISIGDYAFYGCSSLTSMEIPNSVTKIGIFAFAECSSLTSVVIGNSVTTIGNCAFNVCSRLTSVTIGNSVTTIGNNAFLRCSSLTSVTIPNSVTSIGNRAFFSCSSLTSVTIGSSVRSIGNEAFENCDILTTIYSLNPTPPSVGTDNFTYSQYMSANVSVPQEALAAYKTADVWKDFKNIHSMDGTGEEPEKCATPTIHYANNTLTFDCETEGVTFESKITDTDIAAYSSSEIQLGVTYNISVYATKTGYLDSEKTTATLCWIDVDPKTEGIETGVAQVEARAVLIQSKNGQIDVTGLDDGTNIAVYGINGTQLGSAVSRGGNASVDTNMATGSVAIVKIDDRSIKVIVK